MVMCEPCLLRWPALAAAGQPSGTMLRHADGLLRSRRNVFRLFRRASFRSCAARPTAPDFEVPVPLSLRPPVHQAPLIDVLTWKRDYKLKIKEIDDAFATADDGPSRSELERELDWALDDAVAAWRQLEHQSWQPCTWRQLELEFQTAERRGDSTEGWQVRC